MGTAYDRSRSALGRGVAALVGHAALLALLAPPVAWARCDVEALRARAQQNIPAYDVRAVRESGGIVTVLLARPGGGVQFAIAMRTEGTAFFTSVMGAQLDADESAEQAQIGAAVAAWYGNAELLRAIEECSREGTPAGDAAQAVRNAAAAALGTMRLGERSESLIVLAALLVSLAMVLVPAVRGGSVSALPPWTDRRDLIAVLAVAIVALGIAVSVAWRLAPEADEVFTLGQRHQALSYLVGWKVGGEPFNTPGGPVLFSLWLQLADGFFWARVLPMLLIPITALVAYRGAAAAFGRRAGVIFTALVVLAPGYLRIAAIARGYALIVLALCAILATVAATYRSENRGIAIGLAGLLAVWASYLLWPLAIAAPWLARLELRDRLRVSGALTLMAAAIAPRIPNGLSEGMTRSETFELATPADVVGYALARMAHAAPWGYAGDTVIPWLAAGITVALIAMAVVLARRSAPRQLRNALLALLLVTMPVLALLSGGHGIRERHVITVQVVLAWCAAAGLSAMLSHAGSRTARTLGWILTLAIVAISMRGNAALIAQRNEWLADIDSMTAGADLLLIVPRSAQSPVHVMLTGNSPLDSEPARWPPVCESDSEWWCRRVNGIQSASLDEVTDGVIDAAAAAPRSIWIFAAHPEAVRSGIPARLDACAKVFQDATWVVLRCSGAALREGRPEC